MPAQDPGRRRGILTRRTMDHPTYGDKTKIIVCQVEEKALTVYAGVEGWENRWRNATPEDLPNETVIEGYV